jgi:hypothetical protein
MEAEARAAWSRVGELAPDEITAGLDANPQTPAITKAFFDRVLSLDVFDVGTTVITLRMHSGELISGRVRAYSSDGYIRLKVRGRREERFIRLADVQLEDIQVGVSIPELHHLKPGQWISITSRDGTEHVGTFDSFGYRRDDDMMASLEGFPEDGELLWHLNGGRERLRFLPRDFDVRSVKVLPQAPPIRDDAYFGPSRLILNHQTVTHPGRSAVEHVRLMDRLDLHPKHQFQMGDVTYTFTDLFSFNNQDCVLALVKKGDATRLCAFVDSKSLAGYRVVPAILKNDGAMLNFHFEKWQNLARVALPNRVADFLEGQRSQHYRRDISEADAEGLFFGAVPTFEQGANLQVYREKAAGEVPQVVQLARELPRNKLLSTRQGYVPKPQDVAIANSNNRPNFATIARQSRVHHSIEGEVDALVYLSNDGKLEYTVYRTKDNKIWIGLIQLVSPEINQYGVATVAYDARGLRTPLWEHTFELPARYQGESRGGYSDAWNYLREIPEIQEWYRVTGTTRPPANRPRPPR